MRSLVKNVCFVVLFVSSMAFGQGQMDPRITYYRNDLQGDYQYRKEGIMDGNLVRTLYYNYGMVGNWPYAPSGEWPKGSGHEYLDGVAVLVAAEIIAPGNGQAIHPLETQYREEMYIDPATARPCGFEPVPGYVNPSATNPAVNRDPKSFPPAWPVAVGVGPEYNGYWYGYFGKGISNADFETFFVMDDSKDTKYSRLPYKYFPIASDSTRGGLGLRVEVRGFQWSHVLAADIIFWHYDIVNISDRDLTKTCFGFYSDPGVGGNSSGNDDASYSTVLDLCYAWDHLRKGDPLQGIWIPGMYGYAYLESPGNPWNGIDDDEDGLIDERRDNGIDENHNWTKFEDLNGNGKWDAGEDLRDDVGRDGVGPNDLSYTGADQGEADGTPTSGYDALGNDSGYPGEPNIDKTDKDESDQIGLTAVSLTPLSDKGPNGVWPKNNEVVWRKMTGGFVDTGITNSNISIVFSSGPFPLKQGRRERYSMALLFGGGGTGSTFESDLAQISFNKTTVQAIYNANYNFSSPPPPPHVTAVPGNKQVYLYWDNIAESSRDKLLHTKNFEGYTIYRSQEAEFEDVHTIVDSKGNRKYWKPIAQYDLIDTISGPDPVGINGAHFWRGDETGLQHSYLDKDVVNGVKYYYAVCSYSKGDPKYKTGLQPTECTKIITEDVNGVLKFTDINCAVVTPNASAVGYVPASIVGDLKKVTVGIGTGTMTLNIMNPNAIIEDAQYKVAFTSTGVLPAYTTKTIDLIRTTTTAVDTMMHNLDLAAVTAGKFSPSFDGMTLTLTNNDVIDVDTAGWLVGRSNMVMRASADASAAALNVKWPADYEIKFFNAVADTSQLNPDDPIAYPAMPVNFTVTNVTQNHRIKFFVNDVDGSNTLTAGDILRIADPFTDISNFRLPWQLTYDMPRRDAPIYPADGDRFIIHTKKPFYTGDAFVFNTKQNRLDNAIAAKSLDRISVVPNPYVGAARWEGKTIYGTGRGDRKIDFINLPPSCTIRIYSERGMLVKTLYKGNAGSGATAGSVDMLNGALSWNLVTDDGTDVAFGLYLFHVDAPGIGTHIGKFALIK